MPDTPHAPEIIYICHRRKHYTRRHDEYRLFSFDTRYTYDAFISTAGHTDAYISISAQAASRQNTRKEYIISFSSRCRASRRRVSHTLLIRDYATPGFSDTFKAPYALIISASTAATPKPPGYFAAAAE
jgi:hypothetical protein